STVVQVVPLGQPPLQSRRGSRQRPNSSLQIPFAAPGDALTQVTPCVGEQSPSTLHGVQPNSTEQTAPTPVCRQKPAVTSSAAVAGSPCSMMDGRQEVPPAQSASPPRQASLQ